MLISSYVLRRLTYFWCENRDERETFKGVPTGDRRNFANAYGRSSAGAPPHSRPARARAHPGSPPRANCTPGHPTATDCIDLPTLASADLGSAEHSLGWSSCVLWCEPRPHPRFFFHTLFCAHCHRLTALTACWCRLYPLPINTRAILCMAHLHRSVRYDAACSRDIVRARVVRRA